MDTRRRIKLELGYSAVILAFVAVLPLAISNEYWLGVLIVSMYFAMIAAGWNLLAGYTGQFSLAPAAFAMFGAYVTGLAGYYWGISPGMGILAAVVICALIGFVLGRIVLRLSGPYLALTTLAFAEIARNVISNSIDITRGDLGINVAPILTSRLSYYYVFLIALAAVQLWIFLLMRSRAGLFLQAIRDDEIAAASRGVDVVAWKTISFMLSAAIGGLAGALYAHFALLISPELGLLSQSGTIVSMVVIGGMGSLVGPLVGAFLVYALSEVLRDVGGYEHIIFALLVIIFARFFRDGLWGIARRSFGRGTTSALQIGDGSADPLAASVAPLDTTAVKDKREPGVGTRGSPLLAIEHVTKKFGGLKAVIDVSFLVSTGEIVGLVGPNGSGKTTLLNILSGHQKSDSGAIILSSQPVDGLTPDRLAKRGMLRMFQLTRAFRRLTAMDNFLVAGCALGLSEATAVTRASELLTELGLARVAHLEAGQMSGGQLKLVEFGSCFMVPPRIALLDEPFAAIHPTVKEVMARFVRDRHAEGQTFIIASHDMPVITELCPRTVCMSGGEVIAMGETRTVLSKPRVIESYLGENTA